MRTVLLPFLCLSVPLLAQPVIGGAGYSQPAPLSIAPGQLITLFVQGVNTSSTVPVRASGNSLPATLAGVSVTYRQASDVAAPILEVRPISTCFGIPPPAGRGCTTILAVTAQMPFEMLTVCPLCGRVDVPASVAVTVNGIPGPFFSVEPLADQVHILTTCDVLMPGSASAPLNGGLPCQPMITHADGTLVTISSQAHAGEELVAYATGLGQTDPPQQTGKPAASAASSVTTFSMDFNFRPNALATKPLPSGDVRAHPIYAGVTPGFAGLYQINFFVPALPGGLGISRCVDPVSIVASGNVVVSNFTVSIGSNFSFDGAGICVQPLN